jgi:SAM-dependent methyltransferase
MSSNAFSLTEPDSLARLHVYSRLSGDHGLEGQMAERAQLVQTWGIPAGSRVIEVGCGQADTTIALAVAVGSEGHVTAIDPASLDYGWSRRVRVWTCSLLHISGSPYTLGQAQDFIRAGPLASRITFAQTDAVAFAASRAVDAQRFDVAVMSQAAWYFLSPAALRDTLAAMARLAPRVCISEWALQASKPNAGPHVLAALAQAVLETHKPESVANVRTVLSPRAMRALAEDAGLRLVRESMIIPPSEMYDGRWEVSAVRGSSFLKQIEEVVHGDRERSVVLALRDAMIAAYEALGQEKVGSMDVWAAEFAPVASA